MSKDITPTPSVATPIEQNLCVTTPFEHTPSVATTFEQTPKQDSEQSEIEHRDVILHVTDKRTPKVATPLVPTPT
jgi:hypothetical protein